MLGNSNIPLTIITVCKNRVSDIAETCESIIQQKWQNFEWIVVDGVSDDGTGDILAKYSRHIKTLISEPDTGVFNAMNKGIAAASGEWLLFLNGGDRLAGDSVLGDVFFAQTHDEDILFGNEQREKNGKIIGYASVPEKCPIDEYFFVNNCIYHQSTFIRRELFERYGLYNENYKIVSDWEKWIVFAKNKCKFKHLDLTVAVYKYGGLSASGKYEDRRRLEMASMREKHYSEEDLRVAKNRDKQFEGYRTVLSPLCIVGRPLFKVTETYNKNRRVYFFLGLPVMKAKRVGYAQRQFYLFGFIPLFRT